MRAIFILLITTFSIVYANLLQEAINKAPRHSTLKLPNGIYKGNIIINKPLSIIAKGDNVVIQGNNKNTIIQITASNVTLKNLTIQGSGERLENKDAAIKISNAKEVMIDSCTIQDSLYGIEMEMVTDSKISNNQISSKDFDISFKGDAMKLYYSHNNVIKNNYIFNVRDITVAYSNHNLLTQNHIEKSRFALVIDHSHHNTIYENHFALNSVGLMFTGAKDTTIEKNIIKSGLGEAAIGVLIKGVSNFEFKNNIVSYNSKAFYIDAKHNEEEIKRFITHNEISYNMEAFHFHGAIKHNLIKNNAIIGNIDDVVKSVRGNKTSKNIVEQNYWDHYSGFDKDNNNIGDTTYKIYQYADRVWHYNNKIKFFYATPIISILNFILNLAPFIEPVLLLEDTKPTVELLAQQ